MLSRPPIAVALLALTLAIAPASSAERPSPRAACVEVDIAGTCEVRPNSLAIGAKGALKGIDWKRWGGKRAIGIGWLTVAGFPGEPGSGIGPTKGRAKLERRVSCGGELHYGRLTVKYGPGFRKTYVSRATVAFC